MGFVYKIQWFKKKWYKWHKIGKMLLFKFIGEAGGLSFFFSCVKTPAEFYEDEMKSCMMNAKNNGQN